MAVKRKSSSVTVSKKPGDPNWTAAPTEFKRRTVVMEVYGDTNTGRTTLALTAPGPLGLIHAAEKIEGIVQPFAADKEIRLSNFGCTLRGGPGEIAEAASAVIAQFKGAWYDGIDNWAKTVVLDTHTEAWELLRLGRFGTLTPQGDIRHMYTPVNAEWRSLFKHARDQGKCNVIMIGETKDEYKKDKATGRTIRAGQKSIPFMADVIIHTSRSRDGGFVATIEKGWWNAHIEGIEIEDDDINFAYIMGLITETEEDEWK